ncbi:hypothetical protein ACOJQI_09700 [Bacillus salacetis]|uniref:hypothetical protein n=1 Tax=Bacillus salacetis TaxID=2315464 RepID=UPI003BA0104E
MVIICIPEDFYEEQTYLILQKMADSTIYKPVKLQINKGRTMPFERFNINPPYSSKLLIKKVTVEDESGQQFTIDLDLAGLRFVLGEIRYEEYLTIKRKDNKAVITILSVSIGCFVSLGLALSHFI